MRVNELLKIIKGRRSVREYTKRPVSDKKIKVLIDAARYAPSNSNRQPWKFIVLKNSKKISLIAKLVKRKISVIEKKITDTEIKEVFNEYKKYFLFFANAPVVILVLCKLPYHFIKEHAVAEINKNIEVTPEIMSTAMAIQNILLVAYTIKVGACCMTGPLIAAKEIKKTIGIKSPYELIAMIPIGSYGKLPKAAQRKDLSKITEIIK